MKMGIVGAGAMGNAIIQGLFKDTAFAEMELVICESDSEKRASYLGQPQITVTSKVSELSTCNLILLAVKPGSVGEVLFQLHKFPAVLVVSVVAGVTLEQLAAGCGHPVVRVMPNTPALIGAGISAISYGNDISEEQKNQVEQIFSAVGKTRVVPESQLDAVTALSGCGPAYVYTMIEAMVDAGCAQGLPREVAKELVVATFLGASQMVAESSEHPAQLRDKVTSPGGVTISALHVLEQKGLRGILWDAVQRACDTSKELQKR